jgi:levanase/fructan beta-fructosidase
VFDLKASSAGEIHFRIANVNLQYDIKNNQFHGMQQRKGRLGPEKGKALKPDADGLLKIRMLVDWAQLEVFSAGGVFSYSAHLGFTPGDSSLGLSAKGGEVKLVSMTLNEVARIWPAVSPGDTK